MTGPAGSLSPAAERTGQIPLVRSAVPWFTVVALAVVMAYADGFWMLSLRGAVGAIERAGGPFASWLQESTLVLPVFVVAVLGALTVALRWFGPGLGRPRAIVATALMVAAAGTLVGIAEVAASSAYDYHLQSAQLLLMESMGHSGGGTLLAQQASLGLQVRAVGYASGILLVTNLALVGWVVALRGGRLGVSRARVTSRFHNLRVASPRLLLAVALFASGAIHAAAVPGHLTQWPAMGAFFAVLAAAELAVAGLLLART